MSLSLIMFSYDTINFNKINPNCGGLYKDCADWIINKKAAIDPIIKKANKYFQNDVRVALNYEEIKKIE